VQRVVGDLLEVEIDGGGAGSFGVVWARRRAGVMRTRTRNALLLKKRWIRMYFSFDFEQEEV
jgi:hypothetical protein